ncbi:hypothetical protein BP5796_03774 [Coleophoma crateriformis]|uniref:Beta-lactamase-related domain-containing protein n=1 Tax=Coleophoma crateriformis TaxID=565419 RepID=A0A3D8SGH3_9HELO|nr:hypothetical protein BP5796_03774 [Coleophoma crateriformis]
MALSRFEEAVRKAIDEKLIANAVVVASSRGKGFYLRNGTTVLMVSRTSRLQMIATVAILQCVERGLVTLDQPLSSILPEWENPEVFAGEDEVTGQPLVRPSTYDITLRQLLTHTSGMAYAFNSPLIEAWLKSRPSIPHTRDIRQEYIAPLLFAPGTIGKWQYGVGIDWVGQVVERVNGGIRLGEYMQENIFEPLGMTESTFRPLQQPELIARMVPRMKRAEDGSLSIDPMDELPHIEPVDDSAGGGLYSTAADYHRLMVSIMKDDGKVLKTASIDEMFRPQLQECEELQETLSKLGTPKRVASGVPGGSKEVKWNHGLAGVVAVDGVPGVAAKGTMWWSGLANTFWFMDRETGTCGFYGSQLLPASDDATGMLFKQLQEHLYSLANQ